MIIRRLSAALGAEVEGLDLSQPLLDADVCSLAEAFLEYHLLCLRSEPLAPRDFAQVGLYLGELQLLQFKTGTPYLDAPEVSLLDSSYQQPQDKPEDLRYVRLSGWHTDDSYFQIPCKVTLLQALALPSHGGETRFCNMHTAYEDLSVELKERLASLYTIHRYSTPRAFTPPAKLGEDEEAPADAVHPFIRTHDETGKKAIYFNPNRTHEVVGMLTEQSDQLLDEVHAHMTQDKYRYDHRWRIGDILMWDNRSLVHSINADFPVGEKRVHQRLFLKGVRPV